MPPTILRWWKIVDSIPHLVDDEDDDCSEERTVVVVVVVLVRPSVDGEVSRALLIRLAL